MITEPGMAILRFLTTAPRPMPRKELPVRVAYEFARDGLVETVYARSPYKDQGDQLIPHIVIADAGRLLVARSSRGRP